MTERLHEQGRTRDRPWALATAARCDGLIAAARGDLKTARSALERAEAEHRRVPQPFELARTLMIRGEVERRNKQKRAARELTGPRDGHVPTARRAPVVRESRNGAGSCRRSDDARGRAHTDGATGLSVGLRGEDQPRGRRRALREREDRRGQHHQDLPEDGRQVPGPADPRDDRSLTARRPTPTTEEAKGPGTSS